MRLFFAWSFDTEGPQGALLSSVSLRQLLSQLEGFRSSLKVCGYRFVISAVLLPLFFFVDKVFVANPKKPREVTKILVNNKAKLIAYLENFHNDRVSKNYF